MNCSNCGTPIPFDERFCRNCGREVVSAPVGPNAATISLSRAAITEQYNPQAETMRVSAPISAGALPPSGSTKNRSSFLLPITVASIIVALVSIGTLAYFIFSKDKGSPPERPQPAASPMVSSPSATPSPTAQPSATPTPVPSPTSIPTPNNAPPPGARLGYCNDTNVLVRSAPDLNARPLTKITRGQKLWIIATSTNYSTWNGINSNWTQVQIYNGTVRGWVFSPFVSF